MWSLAAGPSAPTISQSPVTSTTLSDCIWKNMLIFNWGPCVCVHRSLWTKHWKWPIIIQIFEFQQHLSVKYCGLCRLASRHQRDFSKVVITHYLPTRLLLSGWPGTLDTNYDVFFFLFFPFISRQKHYFVKTNRETQNWLITFMAPYEKTLRTLHGSVQNDYKAGVSPTVL